MRDVYVEWLISKECSKSDKIVRGLCAVLTAMSAMLFLVSANVLILLIAIALGGFTYFAFTYTDVEYEYIYVSGEFSIDRIVAKSKRKTMERFDIGGIEMIAPLNSHKLDGFAHKKYREVDYTSGVRTPDSHIFVMYCSDGKKVFLEPNRELMEALKDVLPHKVHLDM